MNLNELTKQKSDAIKELENIKNSMLQENRALTKEEREKSENLKEKIENLTESIRLLEETNKDKFKEVPKVEERSLGERLKNLSNGETLQLNEVRAKGLALSSTNANTGSGDNTTPFADTAKKTFADSIIGSITHISGLFNAIRKESIKSAEHNIPISRERIGKFVGISELEEYTRNTNKIEPITLEPNKLGTVIGMSKELVEDYGYDIESYVIKEISDALAETLDEIIVTGMTIGSKSIDGLESFAATSTKNGSDGSHSVSISTNGITIDEISKMYHQLPAKYRNSATWVISDALAEQLTNLKDANSNPLLIPNYNSTPFGSTYTLFGRPVIVNSFVNAELSTANKKVIYFGDLSRALICGIRKTLELTKSSEAGFFHDELMIKATARLDIKKAQGDAIVVGVTKTA